MPVYSARSRSDAERIKRIWLDGIEIPIKWVFEIDTDLGYIRRHLGNENGHRYVVWNDVTKEKEAAWEELHGKVAVELKSESEMQDAQTR